MCGSIIEFIYIPIKFGIKNEKVVHDEEFVYVWINMSIERLEICVEIAKHSININLENSYRPLFSMAVASTVH